MTRIRYRYEAPSTRHARDRFFQVERLGTILSVRGYRFRSYRKSIGCSLTHERVMVTGEKGSATFGGLCWGYGGTGPNGLYELLQKIGMSDTQAFDVAFRSKRRQDHELGNDWEYVRTPLGLWVEESQNRKAV